MGNWTVKGSVTEKYRGLDLNGEYT